VREEMVAILIIRTATMRTVTIVIKNATIFMMTKFTVAVEVAVLTKS